MARSLRDIRRKMKAVKSTRQVTKAMELVAASKMRRAVQNAQLLRQYAIGAWKILRRIGSTGLSHSFLRQRNIKDVLIVVLTSDRGLCGSLNTHILRSTDKYLARAKGLTSGRTDFVAVGRKGQQYLTRSGQKVVATFPAYSNHATFRDVVPLMRFVIDAFKKGEYDHVVLIYSHFISALVQETELKVLLPLSPDDLQKLASSMMQGGKLAEEVALTNFDESQEFLFEPSAEEVLDVILPQLTEVQIYQAVLEAAASEHSARMVAMRSASDNASEILDDLTLTYNQTRQANITGELAELSAGAAALGS